MLFGFLYNAFLFANNVKQCKKNKKIVVKFNIMIYNYCYEEYELFNRVL